MLACSERFQARDSQLPQELAERFESRSAQGVVARRPNTDKARFQNPTDSKTFPDVSALWHFNYIAASTSKPSRTETRHSQKHEKYKLKVRVSAGITSKAFRRQGLSSVPPPRRTLDGHRDRTVCLSKLTTVQGSQQSSLRCAVAVPGAAHVRNHSPTRDVLPRYQTRICPRTALAAGSCPVDPTKQE